MNDLKQKYWSIEAKYERWPPCRNDKYNQLKMAEMDVACNLEIENLFKDCGVSERFMERFKNFMSVSYTFKHEQVEEMLRECSKSETSN